MHFSKALDRLSATELGEMLARREIDAVELTEHFIERIETYDDPAVFTATTFDRARQEAARSAERYAKGVPLGALDGVPIAWKDNIDVADVVTTAGSETRRYAAPASRDATVVANLAAAGMVSLGKTGLSEFAYSALGLNPHFGTPRNPCAKDAARAPGGSSSGSAVAVAAGLAPIAIGTDTGGSIRTPAAFNGIIGYKGSSGRFDSTGVYALSQTLDTLGLFAHQVSDCFLVDAAMRSGDATGMPLQTGHTLETTLFVVPKNVVMDSLEPEVEQNFRASIEVLKNAGARVAWQEVPELDEVQRLGSQHGFIASAEAYWAHRHVLEGPQAAQIDPFVFRRIMAAQTMSAYDLVSLQQGRLKLQKSLTSSLQGKMLLMPTVAHVAPCLDDLENNIEHFASVNAKTIRNTLWANMLDMCALAMPNGTGRADMPTSMAVYAFAGEEGRLLSVARSLSERFVRVRC